jgi:uncharacterized membrane protein YcaP (DUF421 family)
MKVVSLVGLLVVVLILLSFVFIAAGRIEFTELRGFGYIISLLLLDAAQDATHRGDEALSAFASIASVIVAAFTLF